MDAYDNTLLAQARTQYRSIADTVDGQIIVGNEHGYFIKGKVVMGLSQPDTMESFIDEDDLVILGNRAEDQLCAIEANASCLIVCLGAKVGKTIQKTGRGEKSGDHFHTVRFLYRGPSDPPEYSDQVFL